MKAKFLSALLSLSILISMLSALGIAVYARTSQLYTDADKTWHDEVPRGVGDTKDNPYLIKNISELEYLAYLVNSATDDFDGKFIKLDASYKNVNSNGETAALTTTIGKIITKGFCGSFDGNYKKVALNINQTIEDSETQSVGMFGFAYKYIESVFYPKKENTISNVATKGTVKATAPKDTQVNIGGVVGNSKFNILNCSSSCTVSCDSGNKKYVGGVVGLISTGSVNKCSFSGTATGCSHTGGIVANLNSNTKLNNCSVTGQVISLSDSEYAGGVAGYCGANSSLTNCGASGSVTSKAEYTGGIVGINGGPITMINCYATCDISVTKTDDANVGGLCGRNNGPSTITNCYSAAKVTCVAGTNHNVGILFGIDYNALLKNVYSLVHDEDGTKNDINVGLELQGAGDKNNDSVNYPTLDCAQMKETADDLDKNWEQITVNGGSIISRQPALVNALNDYADNKAGQSYDCLTWGIDKNVNNGYPVFTSCLLDTDEDDTAYSSTEKLDQLYDIDTSYVYNDVSKVQVSWKISDIAATVTVNKKWNAETLSWDITDKTDNATGVTAEFDFVNLSSVDITASVSFTANAAYANTQGTTDKYTESYKVDGEVSKQATTNISSVISDRNNAPETVGETAPTAKIEYTVTPQSGTFISQTASGSGTFGTYTVFITEIYKKYAVIGDSCWITSDTDTPDMKQNDVRYLMPQKSETDDEYYLHCTVHSGSEFNRISVFGSADGEKYLYEIDDFLLEQDCEEYELDISVNQIDPEINYIKITTLYDNCLAKGTEITMADGTVKNIENIKEGDEVLTFNHEKGIYEGQKVYLAWASEAPKAAFTLHFTNGIDISVIGDHCFFMKESMNYASILESNAQSFIGKHFYNAKTDTYEELLSVTYETEPTDYYEIYTEYNDNCIAEGMLNAPYDNIMFLNMYQFNDDLTADAEQLNKDIATYGLYEYPCDAEYPAEYHETLRWKYVNIVVGKGFITWEELFARRDAFLAD